MATDDVGTIDMDLLDADDNDFAVAVATAKDSGSILADDVVKAEDLSDDDIADLLAPAPGGTQTELDQPDDPPPPVAAVVTTKKKGGAFDQLADLGISQAPKNRTAVPEHLLRKPWMKFHHFKLIKTVAELADVVNEAMAHGACALDLETEGFDNRIDIEKTPSALILNTRHQIVGYCISVRGRGYYVPVRHNFEASMGMPNPNLPLKAANAEIARLCRASQPVLTEEGLETDPLGSKKIKTPGRLKIYFWNAKFDQEFLFPVCGIEFWHPDSFKDGMIGKYVDYTDAALGLKENAALNLSVSELDMDAQVPEGTDRPLVTHHYEMIEFNELFSKKTPSSERRFKDLYPADGEMCVFYGCSDAICTELLCETRKGVRWDFNQVPAKKEYNQVYHYLDTRISSNGTLRLEDQVTQVTRYFERQRFLCDIPRIQSLMEEAKGELEAYETKIVLAAQAKGFADLNPGSTPQLSEFLFDEKWLDLKPKPPKGKSGQYKTDADTLAKLTDLNPDAEILVWVLKYRQIDKILGTYLASLAANCDENNQLRFKLVQTGARTGRYTAPGGEPDHGYAGLPIQGIPAKNDPKKPKVAHSLRSLFISRPGYTIVKIDYSGQELRIVTNVSKEPLWEDAFLNGDGDLHTLTAKAFFGDWVTKEHKLERGMGKTANFALVYGGGAGAVQRATKCDRAEAARRKANFDKSVPTFAGWVKGQKEKVKKDLGITNAFGRFISIPDANMQPSDVVQHYLAKLKKNPDELIDWNTVHSDAGQEANKIRAACERNAINYPIQSAGADVLKISLVKLYKLFYKKGWLDISGDSSVRILLTVHDEIVFEIKHERLQEALNLIIPEMESPSQMVNWKVPLVAEATLGLSWEAKYDWHDILNGKVPMPQWLVGHVKPHKAYVDEEGKVQDVPDPVRQEPAPTPQHSTTHHAPEVTQVASVAGSMPTSERQPHPPSDRGPSTPPSASRIFQLVLKNASTYESTVKTLFNLVLHCQPFENLDQALYLEVLTQAGEVLVSSDLRVRIAPDQLVGKLTFVPEFQGLKDRVVSHTPVRSSV